MRPLEIAKRHPRLTVNKRMVAAIIATLDENADRFDGGCPEGELSVAFMTDPALAKLHDDFLDDPTTTDVITFEGQPELGVAGEICVSADTAATYAKKHKHVFSEELTLYVVHGWLHLAGYDDLKPELKRRMRRAEARALKLLREKNLTTAFTLAPR